ncbi:hypothetical protein MO973_04690 [Paenibacillus sp. TRM 82003]|nr:hypothetical protein [Paenibacillus sp. TRM 82003]
MKESKPPLHLTAIVAESAAQSLIAAGLDQQMYRFDANGRWSELSDGWTPGAALHRLESVYGHAFACTSQGLLMHRDDRWHRTHLSVPCYRITSLYQTPFAATESGLLHRSGNDWSRATPDETPVYDMLLLPEYWVLGTERGITLYDRYTGEWATFPVAEPVWSVSFADGRIVATTKSGALVVGDRKGGFNRYRFEDQFLFSVRRFGTQTLVCSDQGLYELNAWKGRVVLLALRSGWTVTGVDVLGDRLEMSTLFHGRQSIKNGLTVQPPSS